MSQLNLYSFNTRGIHSSKSKRLAIFNQFKNKNQGIVLLQETHSTSSIEKTWNNEWEGPIIYSHGNSKSKGCAILIPKKPRMHNIR